MITDISIAPTKRFKTLNKHYSTHNVPRVHTQKHTHTHTHTHTHRGGGGDITDRHKQCVCTDYHRVRVQEERQTDRRSEREVGRTDRQTDRQTDRRSEREVGWTNRQRERLIFLPFKNPTWSSLTILDITLERRAARLLAKSL